MTTTPFPADFLWGAASAGHQVEGQNTSSDVWLLEHVEGSIFAEKSGDACDSYHRWPDDLDLVAGLGLNSYRFSLEWARIEPEPGEFSLAALDHYRRVLEGCHARGLTPIVTFHHFVSPRWLLGAGGWEAPETAERFAAFCGRATEHLGDLIGLACTMNEPNLPDLLAVLGVAGGPRGARAHFPMFAHAAAALGVDPSTIAPFQLTSSDEAFAVKLAAHRAGRDAITAVRGDLPVGWTLANTDYHATEGAEDVVADIRARINGRYLVESRDDDFVGVQTYNRTLLGPDGRPAPVPEGALLNSTGEEIYPWALESVIREAADIAGVPVYVTENGLSTDDDTQRVAFFDEAIGCVARCLADGIDVRGYVAWTLLDNFEWIFGYGPKFGLAAVDRTTFARTPKPSAAHLGGIARANGLA
ncbi:glycoside hydrolase family 1 protein [Propioniciclava soli]|uniref:glycoside hydrolase family 1 protein n=1 Tax=Propioniciclava soli TaxID=2775081 RepID=UPI001E56D920|nr:family 1 glycosylhydrolase [Propioniciclava soli]